MSPKKNQNDYIVDGEDMGDEDGHAESGPARGMSDWVRKAVLTGIGTFFMTEEGIRNTVSDLKLPKNVIASLVSQAEKTKADVVKSVAKEVRLFLDGLQVDQLVKKVLSGTAIEIKAQIRLVPQEDPAKSSKKHAHSKAASREASRNEDEDA